MIAALLPALSAPVNPLTLEIEAPKRVRSGEPARVRVWLVNGGETPVTVIAPLQTNYGLGLGFDGDLWRGGKPVATNWAGRWDGQWAVTHEYDARAFATIAPGARLAIEDATYRFEYVSGRRPGLIAEIDTAPHRDLSAGAYVYRAKWSFAPMLERNNAALRAKRRSYPRQTLTPRGEDALRPGLGRNVHRRATGDRARAVGGTIPPDPPPVPGGRCHASDGGGLRKDPRPGRRPSPHRPPTEDLLRTPSVRLTAATSPRGRGEDLGLRLVRVSLRRERSPASRAAPAADPSPPALDKTI